MALALVGAFLVAVDQDHVDAGTRRDVADAGAHEAGADHGEFLHLGRRHVGGAPRALVQFLHRQEQAADHRRRFLGAQDTREVARLDAQRGVDRQLQAFIDAAHDGARRRIIVERLAAVDGVASREHLMPALENTGPPGSLKPFSSQGATALPPPLIQSFAALIRSAARHDGMDQIERLGLLDLDRLALEQHRHRILRRTRRGTRWVPPAPGNSPTFTSGKPSRVLGFSAATR